MRSRLTIFTLVTAWATLLHQLTYPTWMRTGEPLGWALFLVAILVALRPTLRFGLAALALLGLARFASIAPMVRGHIMLEAIVLLGVTAGLVVGVVRLGRRPPYAVEDEESLFESFAPTLRVMTLVVYAFVTLAKLNVDFFDTQESAAVKLLVWTGSIRPFVPTDLWARQATIWGTIALEGGIPILLLFRRTRWLGLVTALLFHALLGLLPLKVASFSLTMCILLAAWLPRGSAAAIDRATDRVASHARISRRSLVRLLTGLALLAGALYAHRAGFWKLQSINFGLGIWTVQTAVMLGALFAVRGCTFEPARAVLRQPSPLMWAFVVLLVVNCTCPYVGLKTRTALTMHSSLRTEGRHWNHLLLPQSMQVFGLQDDLVEIVDSDVWDFRDLARHGRELPYFEFRRWCALAPRDCFVTYRRGDARVRRFEKRGGRGSDPALMERRPIAEWFLCFNPVGASHDYMPSFIEHLGPRGNVVPD
jgi:hypothetical protein